MALYFINTEAGAAIVRARNGHRAQELIGAMGTVMRLEEAGPEQVLIGESPSAAADAPDQSAADAGAREIEVTTMNDCARGVRRYKNKETGAERDEPI